MQNPVKHSMRCLLLGFLVFALPVARADSIYLWCDDASGSLRSFDTNGLAFTYSPSYLLTSWVGPTGLALDNVGNLYVGCPSDSGVYRFNTSGVLEESRHFNDSVSGLAFDYFGKLY